MNKNRFIWLKTFVVAAVAGTLVSTANANLILDKSSSGFEFFSGGSTPTVNSYTPSTAFNSSLFGSLICGYNNIQTHIGSTDSSFCFNSSGRSGSIQYDNEGTFGGANCVVAEDSHGNCYVWDISNCWDGSEGIDIQDICQKGSHITCIQLYGDKVPTTAVPEPSTIIAGALLLLPFGVSTVKILRRKHAVQTIRK